MTTTTAYNQQAEDFLKKFSLRFRCTLSDSKVAPWSAENERHHYRVTLSKARHQIGSGVRLVRRYQIRTYRLTFDFFGSIADAEKGEHPTAYDVLACISGDTHCADTFKEWVSEFGESEDSIKALQTFRRCSAFAKRLQAFFTAEEIEALREIQ